MSKASWRIVWRDAENKKRLRRFHEDVKSAVLFGKELKRSGATDVSLISSKAFPPQEKAGPRPTRRHLWCPYCIKWRPFKVLVVVLKGVRGPDLLRCPVCLISVHDYYIRLHNGMMVIDENKLMRGAAFFDR